MKIIDWINQIVKAQNVWDIGVLKLLCVAVGMILGAYLTDFVLQYVWWFGIISILLLIFLLFRVVKLKP